MCYLCLKIIISFQLHDCIKENVDALMKLTKCDDQDINYFVITPIDDCYRNAKIILNNTSASIGSSSSFISKNMSK